MAYNELDFLPVRAFRSRFGRLETLEGGDKGGSAPAPDYTPMAQASEESAKIAAELGREQLAENKRQFEVNQEVLKPVLDESIKTQQLANKQGEENYNRLVSEGRPIQDQMKTVAMGGDYNDAQKAKQEEAAGQAIADSRAGSSQQMNQLIRQGLRMGWSPAKLAAMGGQAATMGAQNQVASANAARTQKQTQQWGQMGDTYNTYAGLGSTAPAFYNSGTSAGNAASGTQLGLSGQYMNGLSQGNGTIMQGQGMKMQGLGNILNSQTSIYNNSMNQGDGGFGAMLGTAGMIASKIPWSDRRLKENIVQIGEYHNGLPKYEFNYIGDDVRYIGVMAQDVLEVKPEAVVTMPNGMMAVNYNSMNIEMERAH